MHGSILVIAKKKAAGPGGYFDPMGEAPVMGAGPMMFEMVQDEDTSEEPMEAPVVRGGMEGKDVRDIIADLRAAAQRLEDMSSGEGEEEEDADEGPDAEEGPDVEEEEEPEEKPKAKTKKPFPGFGPKKEMKY